VRLPIEFLGQAQQSSSRSLSSERRGRSERFTSRLPRPRFSLHASLVIRGRQTMGHDRSVADGRSRIKDGTFSRMSSIISIHQLSGIPINCGIVKADSPWSASSVAFLSMHRSSHFYEKTGALTNSAHSRVVNIDKFHAILESVSCAHNAMHCKPLTQPRKRKIQFPPFRSLACVTIMQ
jgi:hypothetical protein